LLFDHRKDGAELEKKSATALDRIVQRAQDFNGMSPQSVEQEVKN
jgi:hypothetical protein